MPLRASRSETASSSTRTRGIHPDSMPRRASHVRASSPGSDPSCRARAVGEPCRVGPRAQLGSGDRSGACSIPVMPLGHRSGLDSGQARAARGQSRDDAPTGICKETLTPPGMPRRASPPARDEPTPRPRAVGSARGGPRSISRRRSGRRSQLRRPRARGVAQGRGARPRRVPGDLRRPAGGRWRGRGT
jgi:hypothetical protein